MKFTILSHAGIAIEHGGVQVVMDPWLVGSCYWRSWWNFPPAPEALINDLKPDFIYLTHLHWDHFHGPSLRRLFKASTPILVPKVPTQRMVRDLEWLGFRNVIEMPHGTAFQLGSDFSLRSYQCGPAVDSAAVITGGGVTLFNCNDCKFFGLPLAQITARFPKIDFVLRSHSSAAPVPYCVDDYSRVFPELRSQQHYIDEFCRFALHVGARYAIPFASNHCFLHRETEQFNRTSVSPEDVRYHYEMLTSRTGQDSRCVVMAPGSSWSDVDGFAVVPFDYSRREEYVEQLRERNADTLESQYAKEASTLADYGAFQRYFSSLLAALPRIFSPWLTGRVMFRTHDKEGSHHWLVDLKRRSVEVASANEAADVTIETHPLVLNDCTTQNMFSVWGASKRMRISLASPDCLRTLNSLLTLLDLYELETLPLRRNFAVRSLAVRLRRWRDAAEVARLFLKHVVLRRPFEVSALYPAPGRADGG
jgi:UDP-MurNAc hydroxylase